MRHDLFDTDVNTIVKVTFLFLLLLSVNCLNCIPIVNSVNIPLIRIITGIVLFCICISELGKRSCFFRLEFLVILLSFLFSSFSSYILYKQGIFESIKISFNYIFPLFIYLYLLKYNVSESYVFKVLLLFSIVFLLILVLQQFSYPFYLFCGRDEEDTGKPLDVRMGIYRFTLYGVWFCVLTLVILFQRFMKSRKDKFFYFLMMLIVFFSIVFNLERKVIFSSLTALIIGLIFYKGGSLPSKIALSSIVVAIFVFLPEYMQDLNKQTADELNNSNFVRYLAMRYFFYDMNTSPLYYIFGAGFPGKSNLGTIIDNMKFYYGFYQEDVGIVGYISKTGFFGLFAYLLIVVKIIKNIKYVDMGLLLYLLCLLMVCVFKFWGNSCPNIAAFSVYLYLVDISIKQNIIKAKNYKIL